VGALRELLLDRLAVDVETGVIQIQETTEIGPLFVALLDRDVLSVGRVIRNRVVTAREEGNRVVVRRSQRMLRIQPAGSSLR
jgi:hypothetical protein